MPKPIRTDADRKHNAARMRNDPIWELYRHPRWHDFCVMMKANGNHFCQRIVCGVRCDYVPPATGKSGMYFHHLVSPRVDPSLFVEVRNVVRVCHVHHPPQAGDNPHNEYVPSLYTPPLGGMVIPAWYPQPGQLVSNACPRWSVATVRPATGKPTNFPQGGTTTAVGADAIDRALARMR